jgi:hypothetical protein
MRKTATLIFGVLFIAASVHAQQGGDEATRLAAAGGTMKWSYVPQGRTERFGHAEAIIAAPVSFVRDQATDFAHYKDLSNGRIRTSRLVDKRTGSTDVYLQVPVLHGMLTLWEVMRFGDVHRAADGTETFTGTLVAGNVRASEMTFTIRPAGAGRSIASCDMLLTPQFAAPQSALDSELRDAAESAVRAIASRAEQKYVLASPAPSQNAVAVESAPDAGAP